MRSLKQGYHRGFLTKGTIAFRALVQPFFYMVVEHDIIGPLVAPFAIGQYFDFVIGYTRHFCFGLLWFALVCFGLLWFALCLFFQKLFNFLHFCRGTSSKMPQNLS